MKIMSMRSIIKLVIILISLLLAIMFIAFAALVGKVIGGIFMLIAFIFLITKWRN